MQGIQNRTLPVVNEIIFLNNKISKEKKILTKRKDIIMNKFFILYVNLDPRLDTELKIIFFGS